MKIALAQINTKVGDLKNNKAKIIEYIKKAQSKKADLVVFPELTLTGYPPRDLLDFDSFIEDNIKHFNEIVEFTKNKDIGVICGFVDINKERTGRKYHNTAALIYEGQVLHKHHKGLLPFYDVFDETRYFEPGSKYEPVNFKGKNIGITICEEVWNDKLGSDQRALYSRNPLMELTKKDVDVVVNISASPYQLNKYKHRSSIISGIAEKYELPLVYVNQVGGNDDLLFDGLSFVVDKTGKTKAQCADFEEDLVIYNPDQNEGEPHEYSHTEESSLFKALVVGLKDYFFKMGFKKAVLGLSGGIDSALTAVVAKYALGAENILGITLPSMYSSQGSIDDSKKLAENLGIKCLEIPIEGIFNSYIEHIQNGNGIMMDVAEENLQARIRANILMMYSNRYGYLLLSTGNKSEMSVGYCTLYGDMAGGINVLSDVPKTMVYKVSKYINEKYGEIIPENIITKPPSAELRPDQKDQDSLPEYEVLDDILQAYVEDNEDPAEIAKRYPKEIVEDIVKKINNNEYKRRQATLGLKVTKRAYGSGRRFPIVQGYDFRIK